MFKSSYLKNSFQGEFHDASTEGGRAMQMLYATDASVYQEIPQAVAIPKTVEDIKLLIQYARENNTTLIPRTAGTSLAGQVVGNGIVVDTSVYFTNILEVNKEEKWVRVQPGVIRDDLNKYLKPYGLLFGPETSTASRAMIGGMVGNNSSGLHSIKWGVTRDKLLEAKVLLSDGSETVFKALDAEDLSKMRGGDSLESRIYSGIYDILSKNDNSVLIKNRFPKPSIARRNTGYALDMMLHNQPFNQEGSDFNMCSLLAGSEGTLCMWTELKLALMDLPPQHSVLVCAHFTHLRECLEANVIAMQHAPYAVELVDKRIMDFTAGHPIYAQNRFFISGDPEAVLMIEFFAETEGGAIQQANHLIADFKKQGKGYAYPVLTGDEAVRAWDVRKSGLSLLRNMPTDEQPVNLIEDCAVTVEDLPDYVDDIVAMLEKHDLVASYYAHAGAGELHIEPMINLKSTKGKQQFRQVLADTVGILKKYNGSLSGEHGDGRLRGEFIPEMMGEEVYNLFKQVKHIFDPHGVFNKGKITEAPPMDTHFRYVPEQVPPQLETVFSFKKEQNILKLAEKCSGSGDCRKTHLTGGTMCPSYMASRREHDTTRARANMLRQFLTNSVQPNRFNHVEIKDVMDTCLSCKGCKTECPSSVDVAKMKAEFLQQYYDANGVPVRARLVGNFTKMMRVAGIVSPLYNAFYATPFLRKIANRVVGFHPERTMPMLHRETLRAWFEKHPPSVKTPLKTVYFFCDEFTNYNDVEIGKKAVLLLEKLGYKVLIPKHLESGRTYLSKGLVRKAKDLAVKNIAFLKDKISDNTPLIGLEPSAILTFRDEYLDLVPPQLQAAAEHIAHHTFLIDEFLAREMEVNHISKAYFTKEKKHILFHGHCHQKALSSVSPSQKILSLPENYTVEVLPTGCCGMAGSFGYEKEHFDMSMKIGELALFPAVRKADKGEWIAATGTSCRHQIKDGTGKIAYHPLEVLWEALL